VRRLASGLLLSLRYLMRTEVHVYAFSIAANVLLSFYPFLIVTMSLTRAVFGERVATNAIGLALRDYFPDSLEQFLYRNLPHTGPVQLVSIALLLFTANGVFEPLEVALNRIWGIRKDRSFFRNQLVSLGLIFVCGGLVLTSLVLTALNQQSLQPMVLPSGNLQTLAVNSSAWLSMLFFKLAAVPISVFVLFLIYRYLPNGRPPLHRVMPAAIAVGLILEAAKYVTAWVWPSFQRKIYNEYGVFQYSVTLIFLSFVASLIVLAGAEWSARGQRLDAELPAEGTGFGAPFIQHVTRDELEAEMQGLSEGLVPDKTGVKGDG
jgi:membrane protein